MCDPGPFPADGMLYWAPAAIETNRVTNENSQRNLLQPKLEQVGLPRQAARADWAG